MLFLFYLLMFLYMINVKDTVPGLGWYLAMAENALQR